MAVDAFLTVFGNKLKLLYFGHQVIVERTCESGAKPFVISGS
jgi:hypothetical protein